MIVFCTCQWNEWMNVYQHIAEWNTIKVAFLACWSKKYWDGIDLPNRLQAWCTVTVAVIMHCHMKHYNTSNLDKCITKSFLTHNCSHKNSHNNIQKQKAESEHQDIHHNMQLIHQRKTSSSIWTPWRVDVSCTSWIVSLLGTSNVANLFGTKWLVSLFVTPWVVEVFCTPWAVGLFETSWVVDKIQPLLFFFPSLENCRCFASSDHHEKRNCAKHHNCVNCPEASCPNWVCRQYSQWIHMSMK
jgi:hypothetical protein